MPESYRTNKTDGTLDVEASAKKLAGGYGELKKRMVDVGLPPESADKYELSGFDDATKPMVDELMKDAGMKAFVKGAHGLGFTSKQLSFVLGQYAKVAPELAAGAQELTQQECTTELRKLDGWKSDQEYGKSLGLAFRATEEFGAAIGVKFEDVEKAGLADNPLFIRIMSAIGAELREDTIPNENGGFGSDGKSFDEQVSELAAQIDALDQHDPKRAGLLEKKSQLFARKYSSRRAPLTGA